MSGGEREEKGRGENKNTLLGDVNNNDDDDEKNRGGGRGEREGEEGEARRGK